MAKREYSAHQSKIIRSYYDQRDSIMLQRLQELVTELYLTDSAAKRGQLWDRAGRAMKNLKIPDSIASNILAKRDPKILAMNVQEWLSKAKG